MMETVKFDDYRGYYNGKETRVYHRSRDIFTVPGKLSQTAFENTVAVYKAGFKQGFESGKEDLAKDLRMLLNIDREIETTREALYSQIYEETH